MIINGKDVTREAITKGKNMETKERRYGDDLEEELKKDIQMAQVKIGRKYREMEKNKDNYIAHQEIKDENGDHIVINNSSIDGNTMIGGNANVMSNNRSMSQEDGR